jgi:hypothetical protein
LESVCRLTPTVGSNPTLSAIQSTNFSHWMVLALSKTWMRKNPRACVQADEFIGMVFSLRFPTGIGPLPRIKLFSFLLTGRRCLEAYSGRTVSAVECF